MVSVAILSLEPHKATVGDALSFMTAKARKRNRQAFFAQCLWYKVACWQRWLSYWGEELILLDLIVALCLTVGITTRKETCFKSLLFNHFSSSMYFWQYFPNKFPWNMNATYICWLFTMLWFIHWSLITPVRTNVLYFGEISLHGLCTVKSHH